MATTSIWRVKGWLGKVVVYVENPDKTTNPKFFTDKDMAEQDGQELSDVIRYAVNSRKTQKADNEDCAVVHRFVSGINCSPSTARDEMLAVKKRFGKESGTVAYHGYQSFAPGEATPEMAHEIGMKLAARLWGDRYQVIVVTHLDKENHLHNHFVLNTVSFVDGIKYHRTKKDYHDAEQNGLRLGDMIQLDYYDSGFGEYNNGATANSMLAAEDPGPYRQRYYMSLDDAIGVCKNYTVIGIYTGARFAFGAYQLNADTILVPKASVPNAQNYETRANSLLNTFVLKNGSAKEFEKYMEQQNLAGQFLYFDQDFSSMQESLDALETNAMRLMMVGIGVFLLTSALFLFLNFRRMNLTIRGVRLLGRSSKAVFREIIMVLIPLETLAVLFGTCAAIALFDVVTRNLLSSALTLRPEAMAVSAVTAFVFLMVSTMISTAIFANRKLMKAK